ncbi:MAG: hypothetical protein ABI999_08840 [Acidobacteriota bacterium]
MKIKFVFVAAACLMLVAAAFAQDKAPNFSGHWELDATKSKLDERARVQTMSLDVTQTAADVKVATKTTRMPRPEGSAPGGQGGGGGMGRGGGFGGLDTTMTYTLDGKETSIQQDGPNGPTPVKLKGKIDAGKLQISSSRTFTTPNGDITTSKKETWSLSSDGTTLTIEQEQTNPRGTNTSTLVFVKK